eukprot:12350322-Alexandrium_andersonii.AAC.1
MSASLVGSEMCIRDRCTNETSAALPSGALAGDGVDAMIDNCPLEPKANDWTATARSRNTVMPYCNATFQDSCVASAT